MKALPKYNFYATLLDTFQTYLSSGVVYQTYYGFSDEPSISEEEFERQKLQELFDRINRIPFDSEAADKGTAFNEVVDCIVKGCKSDKVEMVSFKDDGIIKASYNGREFIFPISTCLEFSSYFKGAIPQLYVEAILPTRYGDVKLYGYIDEVMPTKVHDIKTTNQYNVGKYKHGWQHRVYPYCLHRSGVEVNEFEYNIAEFSGKKVNTYTEHYTFRMERDKAALVDICERFVEFLEANRERITDAKVFGLCGAVSA